MNNSPQTRPGPSGGTLMQIKVKKEYRVCGSEHGEEKVEGCRSDSPPRRSAETSSLVKCYLFGGWIVGQM